MVRSTRYKLCDNVCQWLATGRWFSPGPVVSSTNKTDRHDITEILLKVALNTIKQTNKQTMIETKYANDELNIHSICRNWRKQSIISEHYWLPLRFSLMFIQYYRWLLNINLSRIHFTCGYINTKVVPFNYMWPHTLY